MNSRRRNGTIAPSNRNRIPLRIGSAIVDVLQTTTSIECLVDYARYAFRNTNAGQTATVIKCTGTNYRHAGRNIDAGQAATE